MASGNSRLKVYFVTGKGIDKEVIVADIRRYLGPDALVRPGTHKDSKTGQEQVGYYISAYRPLTSDMLADLRTDSAKWQEEKKRQGRIERNQDVMTGIEKWDASKNTRPATSSVPPDYFDGDNLSHSLNASPPPQQSSCMPKPLQQPYYGIQSAPSQSNYSESPPRLDFRQPMYNSTYPQPVDHRPALMRSQSDPVPSGGGNIREIRLIHPTTGQSCNAAALLDTGCATDNWVSAQTVAMIGADHLIDRNAPIKTLQAANMAAVRSRGAITLDWRWLPKGVKINRATFNVADASHYNVIIGNEYIEEKGLNKWVEDAFSPLTEHDPIMSPYESEAMRQARERQQQEKANREAAREKNASRKAGRSERHRQK